jgi:hypothetical protein
MVAVPVYVHNGSLLFNTLCDINFKFLFAAAQMSHPEEGTALRITFSREFYSFGNVMPIIRSYVYLHNNIA